VCCIVCHGRPEQKRVRKCYKPILAAILRADVRAVTDGGNVRVVAISSPGYYATVAMHITQASAERLREETREACKGSCKRLFGGQWPSCTAMSRDTNSTISCG
jgi:hypothetical protein